MQKQEFISWKTTAAVLLAASLVFAWSPLRAQEDLEKPPKISETVRTEEALPPKVQGEQLEPTVTIRDEKDRQIEEYRLNGRVYMIKITPKKGIPYYYIDADGDGQLELDENQQTLNPVQPVQWKIKEWK